MPYLGFDFDASQVERATASTAALRVVSVLIEDSAIKKTKDGQASISSSSPRSSTAHTRVERSGPDEPLAPERPDS